MLNQDAQDALVHQLFPLSDIITPNIYEAEVLINNKISTVDEMKIASQEILKLGAKNVVVKGGHLGEDRATNVLYDGKEGFNLRNEIELCL